MRRQPFSTFLTWRVGARLWVLLLPIILGMHACGFQPRGAVQLPESMQRVYLQGAGADALSRELHLLLGASAVELVRKREAATAVLAVTGGSFDRQVLSVDRRGRAREYELRMGAEFALRTPEGAVLMAPQIVQVRRDYAFDPDAILGSTAEEELLREEMVRDLARLILHRLQYAGR